MRGTQGERSSTGNESGRDRTGSELAIEALAFLAGDETRLERFLAVTGLGPHNLRRAAADPGFLASVLDYLAGDARLLVAFAAGFLGAGASWRWVGWRTTGRARARELKILIMRVAGQAVLIWPLAVRRRYKLWREAIALGPEYTDYHPIVVADTPMADQYMTAAANHLSGLRVADAIRAPFLNAEQAPSVVPRSMHS